MKILMKSKKINSFFVIFIIFLVQFCLFRTYAYREVIGKIPRNADQLSYMSVSYSLYESLIARDWENILDIIKTRCLTGGIPFIGVVNLFIFGRGYFSFLLMNFFCYILTQIVGGISVYAITKKYRYIFLFIGLFTMLMSPFYWAGDLLDFRQDFIAFCLYTCWCGLYIVYLYTDSKKFFFMSAFFGGMLVFCRMLSIVYICVTLLLINVFYVFIYKRVSLKKQLVSMLYYAIVMILSGGWFLVLKLKSFFSYYINLHARYLEPEIRAKEQNVYNLKDNILFYPKSLVIDHLGIGLTILSLCILILVVATYFYKKNKYVVKEKLCILFVLFTIFVPIVILTVDISKSSVVVNIVSGCVILLLTLLIYFSLDFKKNFVIGLVFICSLYGGYCYVSNSMSEHRGYSDLEQKALLNINSEISEYIIENDVENPKILVDHIFDAIKNESVTYYLAEKYDENVYVYNAIQAMNPSSDGIIRQSEVARTFTEEEIKEALECTDIIVISYEGYADSLYITNQQFDIYRELMWNYANDNMELLLEERVENTEVSVFVR